MTNIIIHKASYLGAVLVCTGVRDSRPALNGINLRPQNTNGGVTIYGTDGHRLLRVTDVEGHYRTDAQNVTIQFNADQRRDLQKAANRDVPVHLTLTGGQWSMSLNQVLSPVTLIEVEYPQVERVVPDTVAIPKSAADVPAFNATYLADFAKVHKILGGKYPTIRLLTGTGSDSALVEFTNYPNVTGVIMPVRV